jgi:hypothetical protein
MLFFRNLKGRPRYFGTLTKKRFSVSKMAAGVFGRNKQKKKAYL